MDISVGRLSYSSFLEAVSWRIRRCWQYCWVRFHLLRTPVICVSGIEIPISLPISDNVREALIKGGYEAAELRTIASKLSPEDRVLEVGTGLGLISSYCAARIGGDRVYTYEANPQLEPLIRHVYARNNVTVNLEIGILGNAAGTSDFFVHKDFWSSSKQNRGHSSNVITVPVFDAREVVSRIMPTFLIMDIEGGEVELLEILDLSVFTKVAIELHTHLLGQDKVDELRKFLINSGFKIDQNYSTVIEGHSQELFLTR